MNFSKALECLKSGAKISRKAYKGAVYLVKHGDMILAFQPIKTYYEYDLSIMISEDWQIIGQDETYPFVDMIALLQSGHKARLKDWEKDMFIYIEPGSNIITLETVLPFPFMPDMTSFMADDWIELP